MSFLTTQPEALTYAAGQLQTIGSALASENAGVAAPTTAVAPAAADAVSALQAGIFASYGTLYQQIAAEAQAIHEQFVSTLGISAGSYAATEASNASASSVGTSLTTFMTNLGTLFGGPLTSTGGQPFSLSGNSANFLNFETGNWASAMSDLLGVTTIPYTNMAAAAAAAPAEAASAASSVSPAGAGFAGFGGAPMLAGLGQSASVGGLSVPPSWAAVTTVSSVAPAGTATAGWTTAAPQAAPVAAMPGMPGVAAGARNGGFGAPRYGVKPVVMPKPAVV